MRKLLTTEVLQLNSFKIIPPFTRPANIKVTWPHGATVYLTRVGEAYYIQWGEGQGQLVGTQERTHTRRVRFICPFCGKPVHQIYFNGEKWGCFTCNNIRPTWDANRPTQDDVTSIAEDTTNTKLIKNLARILVNE